MDVEKAWNYSKQNNKSFFIIALYCLLSGLNDVDELRMRIIDDEAVIYDTINAVTPIMNKEKTVFKEIEVEPIKKEQSFDEWYDYVSKKIENTLNASVEAFEVSPYERDTIPIANFSCIPWVDFDTMTNITLDARQIMPAITWGKVNENLQMSVSITVSHIFVYGEHLGQFYERIQYYFDNLF